jgi:indole-3-glycerol phosphate synthase
MGVLDEIVAHKRAEVAELKARRPMATVVGACRGLACARDFEAALRPGPGARVRLIAEVKRASPSQGLFRGDLDPIAQASIYATAGAAAVSVLTDARYFHGSLDDLVQVRRAVPVPVLRKEFIVDDYQVAESRALGADAILLIVGALDDAQLARFASGARDFGMDVLVEVHDQQELHRALKLDTPLIGINNRNLKTFNVSLSSTLDLLPRIPPGRRVVTESGIALPKDVALMRSRGVNAFLVGEAFMRVPDPGAGLAALFG